MSLSYLGNVSSRITATFTGPRRTSLFPKAARPAAPCATYCYPTRVRDSVLCEMQFANACDDRALRSDGLHCPPRVNLNQGKSCEHVAPVLCLGAEPSNRNSIQFARSINQFKTRQKIPQNARLHVRFAIWEILAKKSDVSVVESRL